MNLISLFNIILHESLDLKSGDLILLEGIDIDEEVLLKLANLAKDNGYKVHILNKKINIEYFNHNQQNEFLLNFYSEYEVSLMSKSSAIIGIRNVINPQTKLSDNAKRKLLKDYIYPVHFEYRNRHLQWLYLRLPNAYFAENAKLTTKDFSDYFYSASLISYSKLYQAQKKLVEILSSTSDVRILGFDTDLTFKLGDFGVCNSAGKHNIPDGEVFTAPIRNSVQGRLSINVPTTYYNSYFENIQLNFENGKIDSFTTSGSKKELENILFQDFGSRFIGEFAIGTNPFVDKPINDILFDEKMWGTVHFALGNAYKEADNGNSSSIHWDLIVDQRAPKGGEIYFDGKLIRKNGLFVIDELMHLNPKNLKKHIKNEG